MLTGLVGPCQLYLHQEPQPYLGLRELSLGSGHCGQTGGTAPPPVPSGTSEGNAHTALKRRLLPTRERQCFQEHQARVTAAPCGYLGNCTVLW